MEGNCGSLFSPGKNRAGEYEEPDTIDSLNQLQEKLNECGLLLDVPLPQIVVIGSQSAGKSSLLESIVGREFLPRGTGVVTRRPTVVQLYTSDEEYAVFSHLPQQVFKDFRDVMKEIKDETNKDPGPSGFSSKPIILKIYSPNVLKLTLVDLPGLIMVAMNNSEEDDSEQAIHNMVMDYIRKPNSLILAVTPANQDLENSHALKVAKSVDPERVRTIGVLTKLDLAEEGTESTWIKVLENQKLPLGKGYVGVINRSQSDNEAGRDIAYGINKEKEFFLNSCYRHLASKMGTIYLQQMLHQELKKHIKLMLPEVRLVVSEKLSYLRKELMDLQSLVGDNSGSNTVRRIVIRLVQKFIKLMDVEIYGLSTSVDMDKLSAGSLMNCKLNACIEKLSLPDIPEQKEILRIIINMHGVRNFWSVPSLSADAVCNRLLSKYIKPLNNCVDYIARIFDSCVEDVANVTEQYPSLKIELLELVRKSIEEAAFRTKEALEMHIKPETNMNINHKDFEFPNIEMSETVKLFKLWNSDSRTENVTVGSSDSNLSSDVHENFDEIAVLDRILSENECAKKEIDFLKEIIMRYLEIQKKQISNTTFKYILSNLVDQVMKYIKSDLITALLESENYEKISQDCERDFIRMRKIKESCECLRLAMKSIQRFE